MIESRRPESGLLLIFTLLFVFTIACGSDDSDGDNLPSDGDMDLEELDLEPMAEEDLEAGDGDYAEREFEKFVWEDDTYGQWSLRPFCLGGNLKLTDKFEADQLDPRWALDYLVPENVEADPSGANWPVIVEEDGNRFISGRAENLPDELPPGRIYTALPDGANSFHFLTRLPADGGENMAWFNDDEDPSGTWLPEVRFFHNASLPEWFEEPNRAPNPAPQLASVVSQNNFVWGYLGELSDAWHIVEIYQLAGTGWRIDVDRITIADFAYSFDPERPAAFLFLGRQGDLDNVLMGDCPIPPTGTKCDVTVDCLFGQVCGRDSVCYEPRGVTCLSDLQCEDDSICLGINFGEDVLGDGTCSIPCTQHADCRPYELCLPYSKTDGFCRTICEGEGTFCPEKQQCMEIGGVNGCLPEVCRENASWVSQDNGLIVCICDEGFVENPFSGRCEEVVSCTKDEDCQKRELCSEDICMINRNVSCYEGSGNCPFNTECFGHIMNDVIAGTGQCAASCNYAGDCLSYERCLNVDDGHYLCLGQCEDDSDCSENLGCVELAGGNVCMPNLCKTHGIWQYDEEKGYMACQCEEGYSTDTVSGQCRKL